MGLWDSVTGFFEDLGDFFSGKDFFECAGYAWNDMMQLASDVLTKKEVINLKKERICIQEAHILGIPLIGIVDTNFGCALRRTVRTWYG